MSAGDTHARTRGTGRLVLGVLGELLLTAGVVVALFVGYALYGTGVSTSRAQGELAGRLDRAATPAEPTAGDAQDAEVGPSEPRAGDAYARMRIPRLGDDWEWVVVQGVEVSDLRRGPGHYPGTADPGEVGNLAVAGHRATYGEPFAALDRLVAGDDIVVEFAGSRFRYVVTDSFVTTPDDVSVLAAVPGDPGAVPTRASITLTTCHPRFSGAERLVVQGVLEGQAA